MVAICLMLHCRLSSSVVAPVPRVLLGQQDALNDCLVLENLAVAGFRQSSREESGEVAHCQAALQALAQLHALSLALGRRGRRTITNLTFAKP